MVLQEDVRGCYLEGDCCDHYTHCWRSCPTPTLPGLLLAAPKPWEAGPGADVGEVFPWASGSF